MKPNQLKLIRLLAREQQADGSFVSWSVPAGASFYGQRRTYQTTFVTSIILGAVAGIDQPELDQVRQQGAAFLQTQAGSRWSFNYWTRDAPEASSQPYPDDWDDSSCALAALTLIRPEVVGGDVLAHVVSLLTQTEAEEGGPYWTWIVPPDAPPVWRDVDVAVNSNIAYFLHLHGVELPNLEQMADERIARRALRSPYYPTAYPLVYFLSRWYRGRRRVELADWLMAQQSGGRWDGVLATALGLSAALQLGVQPERLEAAAQWLEAATVEAEAFCLDPAIDQQAYVAGAPALTAALMLEALSRYEALRSGSGSERNSGGSAQAPTYEDLHEAVVQRVRTRLADWSPELTAAYERMSQRILEHDAGRQITLLPALFRQAAGEAGARLDDEVLVDWGTISLWGWLAYTIYDDFLDAEGEPSFLPLANVGLRELVLGLERQPLEAAVRTKLWQVLDRMEAANAWEVTHCRIAVPAEWRVAALPDYGDFQQLAARSWGHALGCLALAARLGNGPQTPGWRAVEAFFQHYLIARQLNDDAHDWKDDLERGQINAVGAMILHSADRAGDGAAWNRLEEQFWNHTLTTVCQRVVDELAAARASLRQAEFLERPEALEPLLAPIEIATHKALEQQRQTQAFLRTYGRGNSQA